MEYKHFDERDEIDEAENRGFKAGIALGICLFLVGYVLVQLVIEGWRFCTL